MERCEVLGALHIGYPSTIVSALETWTISDTKFISSHWRASSSSFLRPL